MIKTVYIVPAWSDQAGQCRIVARDTDTKIPNPARDYKEKPELWKEVGIMNSRGDLVCYTGPSEEYQDIKSCEPLMAGLVFDYEIH